MTEKVFGIDFGTTNTVVFSADDGKLENIKLKGKMILPSTVNYDSKNSFDLGEQNDKSIFSVKKFLGTEKNFNGHSIESIYKDIFQFLRDNICDQNNLNAKVVLTVPAYFNDIQRNTMKNSANNAGFTTLKILSEPTAAIFGHDLKKDGIYGVYDFGGGTFDFSVVEYKLGVFKVLKTGGNLNLGGDDIDNEIIELLKNKYHIILPENLFFKNKISIEKLKSSITDDDKSVNFSYYSDIDHIETVRMVSLEIKTIAEKYISKTIEIVKNTIDDCNINFENIILVGGSSKFSFIKNILAKSINVNESKIITKSPDIIVAIGAAKYADFIVNKKSKSLIDVTPLTLGIEIFGGFVDPIIKRNSQIPIEKTEIYTKDSPDQKNIKINILQGEREVAKYCTSLGTIILKNLPSGKPKIYVKFKIDIDGILSVNAWTDNDINEEITINPIYNLDKKKVETILIKDSEEGKGDIKLRLLYEAKLRANNLIDYINKFQKNNPEMIDSDTLETMKQLKTEITNSYDNLYELQNLSDSLEQIVKTFAEQSIKNTIIKSLKV